jgi:hypothetical protein
VNSKDAWQKYCGFFEKSFSQQLEENEKELNGHFEVWKKTDSASLIGGQKAKTIDELPLTSYSDYPFLTEFGNSVENKLATTVRKPGESLLNFYVRILPECWENYINYMPDTPYLASKTTGTTGRNKWIIYGKQAWESFHANSIALVLMCCAKSWGDPTALDRKLNALSLVAPVPYMSGWSVNTWAEVINMVPSLEVVENTNDMGKKFQITLKEIENGKKIELAGGSGSFLYMVFKYFTDPKFFFSESFSNTSSSIKKSLIALKLLQLKLSRGKCSDIRELMPLKGVVVGNVDAKLYASFFEDEFGIEPLNSYGLTEAGFIMAGRPHRKKDLFPTLSLNYFEFLDQKGEVKKLDEVSRDAVYELAITPLASCLIRYRTGDLFKVDDFSDDGMPIFMFQGRVETMIDYLGYFRVTDDTMAKAFVAAGIALSDKWAVTKILEPTERLHILLEKEWGATEEELEQRIFDALVNTLHDFSNYVRDFNIKSPSAVLNVEFLRKGAFVRYSIKQVRKGSPLGQLKPPKLIPVSRHEVFQEIRECGH